MSELDPSAAFADATVIDDGSSSEESREAKTVGKMVCDGHGCHGQFGAG